MNTRQRSTSSCSSDVTKPAANADKRVEQDAEGQHAPAAEQVGEIAAEQAEHAAGDRRHEEQRARPLHVHFTARHPSAGLRPRHAAAHQLSTAAR